MSRVHNFSAGPAALPAPVLAKAPAELTDFAGTGSSVMEISHRGSVFGEVAAAAEADLRDLLAIPENYQVLFLQGGVTLPFSAIPLNLDDSAMWANYVRKSNALYAAIDSSDFYSIPVLPAFRSRMNVPFTLARPDLDTAFLAGAEQRGLVGLKGHRSVGDMRASLYDAMPEEGVASLVQYMQEFERIHG